MISHVGLNRALIAAAEAESIPYQLEVLTGGTTDAFAMQTTRAGVLLSRSSVHSFRKRSASSCLFPAEVPRFVPDMPDFGRPYMPGAERRSDLLLLVWYGLLQQPHAHAYLVEPASHVRCLHSVFEA
jgi:hypothetical protein